MNCCNWKLHREKYDEDVFPDNEVSDELQNCSFECTISRKSRAKEGPSKESVPPPQQATNDIVQLDVYNRFISIKDPDFKSKVRKCMEEEVKERAYLTLLDPKRSKPAGDKAILSLAKKEFSNQVSIAKPA